MTIIPWEILILISTTLLISSQERWGISFSSVGDSPSLLKLL